MNEYEYAIRGWLISSEELITIIPWTYEWKNKIMKISPQHRVDLLHILGNYLASKHDIVTPDRFSQSIQSKLTPNTIFDELIVWKHDLSDNFIIGVLDSYNLPPVDELATILNRDSEPYSVFCVAIDD